MECYHLERKCIEFYKYWVSLFISPKFHYLYVYTLYILNVYLRYFSMHYLMVLLKHYFKLCSKRQSRIEFQSYQRSLYLLFRNFFKGFSSFFVLYHPYSISNAFQFHWFPVSFYYMSKYENSLDWSSIWNCISSYLFISTRSFSLFCLCCSNKCIS